MLSKSIIFAIKWQIVSLVYTNKSCAWSSPRSVDHHQSNSTSTALISLQSSYSSSWFFFYNSTTPSIQPTIHHAFLPLTELYSIIMYWISRLLRRKFRFANFSDLQKNTIKICLWRWSFTNPPLSTPDDDVHRTPADRVAYRQPAKLYLNRRERPTNVSLRQRRSNNRFGCFSAKQTQSPLNIISKLAME